MSVEAPKTVEETAPVETKPTEVATETPAAVASETPAVDAPKTESTETPAAATAEETKPTEEAKKDETVVEAVPASEGVLGYKAPGFLKQFHFSKQFFFFSEEALSSEALTSYVRSEKTGVAQNAAWARETGKGVLFHTKRSEDKAHPAGLIPLAEATNVTKEGTLLFSFDVQGKTHKFEATSAAERDSWVVAIEKQVEETKALKDEITGRDSYKKQLEEYSKPTVVAAAAGPRSKSKEPKKSLDANTATAAANGETKPEEAAATPATTEAKPEEKKDTTKERSQSRKRTSIFGSLMGKKDEAKEEKKADDKAQKEEKKEEKKAEAEVIKEEAKEEHDATKAAEAAAATAGAAAVAAAPAAVVSDNKEEKKEDKKEEPTSEATSPTSPTDKKAKRGSVFGSFFNKKVTSPTAEKSEKEVGPTPPAKDDVPPVSDTAPKLDEPIENKPIDAAAVTAPANTDGAAETTEPAKETRPEIKSEKKSFLGFMKKPETKKDEAKKEEAKEEKPAETTEAAAATEATPATDATDATKTDEAAKEEKPAADKEKRRTSLFGGLGTIKKKRDESETKEDGTERKREKSPLPSKIGGLFRKPSKAVKSDESKATETKETKDEVKDENKTETPAEAATTTDAAATEAKADAPATEAADSKIVGDVVPETLQAQETPAAAPEVKATA